MARSLARALADYGVDWQRVPWPIRWSGVFGRTAPLALEIGFGNGAFLAGEARAHPERDHVGIDLSWTAATHLFRRLRRADARNVRVLIGDAETLVCNAFGSGVLSDVVVNHPCPWPKARHHERRLLARGFLARLAERMRPGARLTVVTDHAEYAHWLGEELAAQRELVSCHATREVSAIVGRAPTKYQLKAMAQGVPIHYFEWQKPESAAAHAPVVPADELVMPNLTLRSDVAGDELFDELFRGFRPVLFRERVADGDEEMEVVVKLEGVYRRAEPAGGARVWLVEALAQEGRLRQQFAIYVVARESSVLLKPAAIGEPYPTHGVKRAVWCAARWIQSRNPELELLHESLGLSTPREPWPPLERSD